MEQVERMNSVESDGFAFTPAPGERGASKRASTRKLTDWQRFFLTRLDYLLDMQRSNPPADAEKATLVSKAVYSTYLDCQTQGVGDQALERIAVTGPAQPSAN
jgi:hypothetical protein